MAMWIGIFIVIYPLMTLAAGRHWTWGGYFIFAGIAILVFGLVGVLYVLGSQIPKKRDE